MWLLYKVRHDTLYHYDAVGYSPSGHLRCFASLKVSICLVCQCLQVLLVAIIVDWDGLPVCCDVNDCFIDDVTYVRDVKSVCRV